MSTTKSQQETEEPPSDKQLLQASRSSKMTKKASLIVCPSTLCIVEKTNRLNKRGVETLFSITENELSESSEHTRVREVVSCDSGKGS